MSQTKNTLHSATIYQALYLTNLLLLPGVSFLLLLWLFNKNRHPKDWHRIHLYRSIQLSIIAGVLLVLVPLIVVYGGSEFEASVMVMLVYFVTIHALLVLLGMLNISRAMAKKLPLF
ncbi:hypothetical protein [Thalassotalea castellviae]|uniref:DUF4870 domain-containing protein n=1 Tax=Thalassotalea castellviae TaxID=3075612 RepID=A0ABU2ZZ10_9GAMM|nr:hypothetical protein [Thalassotalea sp. W431]MDT0602939.1 hypothetical protein [Thalassotalea sp. W431]